MGRDERNDPVEGQHARDATPSGSNRNGNGEAHTNGRARPVPSVPGGQLFADLPALGREPALRPPGPTRVDGDLLAFLSPGLVHSLGNQIFAIQGNARLLASGQGQSNRYKNTILEACRNAEHGVEVLRYLTEDRSAPTCRPVQVGPLLSRVCHVARVPFRDRGLTLSCGHSSSEVPRLVDPVVFVHCVAGTFQAIAEGLPTVFHGTVLVDLEAQGAGRVSLLLTIESKQAMLPFPLELDRIEHRLTPRFRDHGAEVRAEPPDRLRLSLPVGR